MARNRNKIGDDVRGELFVAQQTHILGCLGEWAASQALKVEMDESLYGVHGDRGCDLATRWGSVSVKYNHRDRGYLLLQSWAELKTDWLVLVYGSCRPPDCQCASQIKGPDPMCVTVAGCIEAPHFKKIASRSDWGLGERFWCRPDQLLPTCWIRHA